MIKSEEYVNAPPDPLRVEEVVQTVKIDITSYNSKHYEERRVQEIIFPVRDEPTVTWIRIGNIHQAGIVDEIGNLFSVHPLMIESILDVGQIPKVEDFGNYLFILLKTLSYDDEKDEIKVEQISLILVEGFVLSLQEGEDPVLDTVRERLMNKKGRIRAMGADYLAYSIIDVIVDNYSLVFDKFSVKLDRVEQSLLANPTPQTMEEINHLKREILDVRNLLKPLNEVVRSLQKGQSHLLDEATLLYFKDLYDHTEQTLENIGAIQEVIAAMLDTYFSSMNQSMNEVMKVLTVISVLFMPLTFIAGIYGMNFEFMPELDSHWGYPIVLLVMLVMALVMMALFKKNKWL